LEGQDKHQATEGFAVDSPENDDDRRRALDREAEKYRQATEHALGQLEWCIDYLYKLRKVEIARTLSRNRAEIMARIR
jgi:hypothetical protein